MTLKVAEHIRSIAPYVPGKPLEALEREYGIADSVKLASNENPLGPSPRAVAAIGEALGRLHRYPDGSAFALTRKLARRLAVEPDRIVLGNGSDEILGMLSRVLLGPGDEAAMPQPSFLMYEITVRASGAAPVFVPLKDLAIDLDRVADAVGDRTRIVFLCNPNNPTGSAIGRERLSAFLAQIPEKIVVVLDEAYMEFVRDPAVVSGLAMKDTDRPLVVLRTFSKAYGLAGLRIGYAVMQAELAELLHRVRMPFNVSSLAQIGAAAALDDQEFLNRTVRQVHQGLDFLFKELARMGIACFPTQANFFLIDAGKSADAVFEALLKRGVIVRSMSAYGYPTYIRVNAGADEENRRLIRALEQVL